MQISFETLSGTLTVRKDGEWITLDFPAEPVTGVAVVKYPGEELQNRMDRAYSTTGPVPGLSEARGTEPLFTGRNRLDIITELPSEDNVCDLDPDISALVALPARDVIVTAVSDLPQHDLVSGFF